MLTLAQMQAKLLAATPAPTDTDTLGLDGALGRVLAQDLVSTIDVPPADNTAMDGYALRCADVPTLGAELPVSQRVPAGSVSQPLQAGTVARIFTGAQVPEGADAIVMQELCVARDGGRVQINTLPTAGQWIRRRGEDVRAGATVLGAGTRLTPQALGLAATVGAAQLTVWRRPRVALLSTGNELVMPGQPLPPGAIYNANRSTLRALVQSLGCECTDLGTVPDQLDATRAALHAAAQTHDLVLSSGGVSVGEEDHLRAAVAAEGQLQAWHVAMKPGRPLAFGQLRRTSAGQALYLGLPGNPVSSFITFFLAVRPVLLRLMGSVVTPPLAHTLRADFDWPRADKRREFLRVRRNAEGGLDLFANQSSGVLTSAHWADGVVDNPPDQPIARGDLVRFIPFSEWLT